MADNEPWGPRAMNERLRKTVESQARQIELLTEENSNLSIELVNARDEIRRLRHEMTKGDEHVR